MKPQKSLKGLSALKDLHTLKSTERDVTRSSKKSKKKQQKKAQRDAIFGKELAQRLFSDQPVQPTKKTEHKTFNKKDTIQSPEKPSISHADRALFMQSMAHVTPIHSTKRAEHKVHITPPTRAILEKRALAEGRTIDEQAHNLQPVFKEKTRKPGINYQATKTQEDEGFYIQHPDHRDLLQKLKRLYWPVEASLDLHGATVDEARTRFNRFMSSCIEHHVRCVCLIHGKGYGSPQGQSVLKPQILSWLKQIGAVQAFIPAPEQLGGQGAVLVLIKGS
ncbi:MAG: Smr/MutS family protein [Alcaligenaceae bacterium]|nr:Smr/MutS family protein [Alcaligenaceae bacterium]